MPEIASITLPVPNSPSLQAPQLDVVIPVHNEAADLFASVLRLHRHLSEEIPFSFRITIADNASTDATWEIATALASEIAEVSAVHLDLKGRGRALAQVWQTSDAQVLVYMDVDLSTDLAALLPLIAPLISGHSDIAIGSRLARDSRVVRGPKRELISRGYNMLVRTALAAQFSDAQCGFKAIRADRARILLPQIRDTGWFFDTELLLVAERVGLRIHEVPVDWVDDPNSSVDILDTAREDVRGLLRVGRGLASGAIPIEELRSAVSRGSDSETPTKQTLLRQASRFAAVGIASTLAYLALYLAFRSLVTPQSANAIALLLTALANTALNRRLTFGLRGRASFWRHHTQGLVVFGIGLGLTAIALWVLGAIAPAATRPLELTVLITANLIATCVRFLLFRAWVFPNRRRSYDIGVTA